MTWWNNARIEWYIRASENCSFHQNLATIIEEELDKEDSIIELGTGLGYVAEIIKRKGYNISAIDIDKRVIELASSRSTLPIFFVEDYRNITQEYDTVLCIFFGRAEEEENLSSLLKLAKKKLIYIISEHIGQNKALISRSPNEAKLNEKIRELGLSYKSEKYTLSFPEPLKSIEEGKSFIAQYYPKDKWQEYESYITPSFEGEYPYVFKNDKKIIKYTFYK